MISSKSSLGGNIKRKKSKGDIVVVAIICYYSFIFLKQQATSSPTFFKHFIVHFAWELWHALAGLQ
jgi:hypothetical protein